jgi:ribosome-binding protein aMBF1 (putative translation factor)
MSKSGIGLGWHYSAWCRTRSPPQSERVATRDSALRKRFGLALQKARRELGISQEELAYGSNLQVSFISRVERGLQAPSLEAIAVLAAALGTKPHLLVMAAEGEEEPGN